ncbi:MAG: hypothetical protein A07HB70_01663 [uncultured archaeon A07HB70]|nr:MAG: hypothetical protein A07HB70_01663 [uncultured archaeon A07HB70]
MTGLRVHVGDEALTAAWVEGAPETRAALDAALPLSGDAHRWGDELYVDVPVAVGPEDASASVPVGAVAYWPAGPALCLFWGPTPASSGQEPRAASPVTLVGRLDDPDALAALDPPGGVSVRVERRD